MKKLTRGLAPLMLIALIIGSLAGCSGKDMNVETDYEQILAEREGEIQRLSDSKDLEGGPQFIDALNGTVEQGAVARLALGGGTGAIIGIKGRQRGHRNDFAGFDIHQDRGRALPVGWMLK